MTPMSDVAMPSMNPLVSIVVIFLNEERFLAEAIESVLAQTQSAWELLLVDDGSTDASADVARGYVACMPGRARYLSHPGRRNRGMSASRNLGLAEARGAYVGFLDGDDVLYPTAIEEQVALLEAHPDAALVYGPAEWWYSWTANAVDADRDVIQAIGVAPDRVIEPPLLLSTFLLHEGTHPTGPLYRRDLLLEIGGFEGRFRGMYEDQVVRVKLCLRYPAYVSGRCWYRYRQHPDSCCARAVQRGRHQRARAVFLNWVGTYLDAQGIDNLAVRRAHRQALWQCQQRRLLGVLQRLRAASTLRLNTFWASRFRARGVACAGAAHQRHGPPSDGAGCPSHGVLADESGLPVRRVRSEMR